MPTDTLTLTARCLCNAHHFTTPVPLASLPLRATACHCSSCRHVTGALYASDAPWPGDPAAVRDSGLASYPFSDRLALRFCGTCGTSMFWESRAEGTYAVFTGALENVPHPDGGLVVQIVEHGFVGDTVDGGAVGWLRRPHGEVAEPARVWLGRRGESEEVVWPATWPAELPSGVKAGGVEEVGVECRCGGVDFVFKAGEMQRESRRAREKGEEWGDMHWRAMDPETQMGVGTFDACDSCRLAAGVDFFHWTFPFLRFLGFKEEGGRGFPGTTEELWKAVEGGEETRFGTLGMYRSSEGVQRYFCKRCSACVFYATDRAPDLVDLAIGLLRAPDGARAESIILWNFGEVMYREDMVGGWREGLSLAVERESEEWRVNRGYPKSWRRLKREEDASAAGVNKGDDA
ncbi:hypothetical protein QBC39DRAFT_249285 [Podospora conica]|nr:hypothetical protein QBC39DRAFT_249285 [Schizothecium conicum]